jgi:hypothetical protein
MPKNCKFKLTTLIHKYFYNLGHKPLFSLCGCVTLLQAVYFRSGFLTARERRMKRKGRRVVAAALQEGERARRIVTKVFLK